MGGGSCTNSNTDENRTILIPQEALSVSIGADSGLKHTVSFEAAEEWQASVLQTRSDAWITIDPESGSAGKNNIAVTLTENTEETSRKAVITIHCGGESVSITITQRGVGEPEDPDDPNNPDNPQKPEHPAVSPENRLTYIETTYTGIYSDGTSTDKGYMLFEYDADGLLTGQKQYDFDSEQTGKINASYETNITRNQGKIALQEKYLEIRGYYEELPLSYSGEHTFEYRLNASGMLSGYTDPDGDSQTFTYNADGTLARMEYRSPSYPEENSTSTLTWQDGNIVSVSTVGERDNSTMTFTYTEHLNPWCGIDLGAFVIGDVEEVGTLLGISGMTVKNLPASRTDEDGDRYTFSYEFDAQGRVSKIEINETWHDGGGSGSDRTEYVLHYGPQNIAKPEYIPYLTKQEVVEEGTLPYTFSEENPDEKWYGPNAYTSYAKIQSVLSDGTKKEKTEYREVYSWLTPQGGSLLGYIYVTQDEVDNFRLVSTSFNEVLQDENVINPHRFVYTLEYNCFKVNMECEVYYPSCMIFDPATGEHKTHWMPMHPFDKSCIKILQPELRYIGENTDENGPMSEYDYIHRYLFQVNPDVEAMEYDYQQLNRFVYVAHY